MKKILLIVGLVGISVSAWSTVPQEYNGVRCNTKEGAGDVYASIYRGNPGGLYWIAHDRVEVLANDLTEKDEVITGRDLQGRGEYTFDFGRSTFQLKDSGGLVVQAYSEMHCELCPANLDRCPNAARAPLK